MNQNNDAQKPMVENISCILPETQELGGLFLGNVFGAQNAAILKQYGIRAVITASAETKISHSIDDIPFHLKIDAHDKDDYYIVEHVNDCIHFIEQNRKNTNVFVHCYAGVSRSSAIVAAYLMWKYRWPLEKTLAFLVFKRIVAKPNDGFYKQLKEVEVKLNIASQNTNQPTLQSNTQNLKQKAIIKPNSPPLAETLLEKRPSSTKAPAAMLKPQSPPLQLQSFNPNGSGQQFYAQKGDPYMAHLQNPNLNRSGSQAVPQNHNHIPIPKVLAKRQQQPPSTYGSNEYYDQIRNDNKQKGRKSIYNDYMSPDVIPTSPKQNASNKMSLGKVGLSQNRNSNSNYYNTAKDYESSLYTTNNSSNGLNASKRGFESQQKSKTGSRCIIRPKDLPGYKNY